MISKIIKVFLCTLVLITLGCTDSKEDRREEIEETMKEVAVAFDEDQLTDSLALAAADMHLEYIEDFPEDTSQNPQYYYEALKLTTEAEAYDRSLALIDTFLGKYPNHDLAPYMLHFKAYYIYERGTKDYAKAERTYKKFLEKYPGHEELTSAVLFSLEHLGKSDDEVLKEILKKSDQEKKPMP